MKRNLVGSLIKGQYRVEQRLGKGGFAEVYLAIDTRFGARKVAIKVLLPEIAANEEDVSRFLDEAKISGNIHDPNRHLIQVHEFGSWEGLHFMVMEYLEGRSLRAELEKRERPLAHTEALDIAAQVCEGLAAAHRQGVAHRDLKPENIFLCPTPSGTNVRLLDLGIAKVVDDRIVGGLRHRSRVGAVLGTPTYLAPEMFSGKVDSYYLADIYALGVVLYEMLVGEPPFLGSNLAYYVYAHARTEPMRPSEVNPGLKLPESVDELVLSCLAKNPEERPPTPEALAGWIRSILAGETRPGVRRDDTQTKPRPTAAPSQSFIFNETAPQEAPAPVHPIAAPRDALTPDVPPVATVARERSPPRPVEVHPVAGLPPASPRIPEPPAAASGTILGLGLTPEPRPAPPVGRAPVPREQRIETIRESNTPGATPSTGEATPESEGPRMFFIGLMFLAALISMFTTATLVMKIVDTSWMQASGPRRSRPPPTRTTPREEHSPLPVTK